LAARKASILFYEEQIYKSNGDLPVLFIEEFSMATNPTIVLIHGALSDASVWNAVNGKLQQENYAVLAPAMPMRNLAEDISYLASFLSTVDGPVVLVGHSYAGTVISAPTFAREQVLGLVYISAFAPDSGESSGELNGRWPGSTLNGDTTFVRTSPFGQDLYLKLESFGSVYGHDLPESTVSLMASSQRPINTSALGESFQGEPAWTTRPGWMLISTEDRSLPPAAQRFMAARMGATVTEVDCSHAAPVSRPSAVFELIEDAVRSTTRH
jgi:pimeloyl-ACP methyl ester carboxylesterase